MLCKTGASQFVRDVTVYVRLGRVESTDVKESNLCLSSGIIFVCTMKKTFETLVCIQITSCFFQVQ